MAGERSERMVVLAARAGARIARVQQIITDKYAKPDEEAELLAEMNREIQTTGHAYDENCTRPFCVKYRRMFLDSLAQALQGGA